MMLWELALVVAIVTYVCGSIAAWLLQRRLGTARETLFDFLFFPWK